MELPHLGDHCSSKSCKQLDFLPMKCDACSQIFCGDHIMYNCHQCTESYKKDNQVPVCPLCNQPVPIKKNEVPDAVVGQHIDNDCQSDPARKRRKIYTNRCSHKGCKQKELIPVICDTCQNNFCLKHRNELDHDCQGFEDTGRGMSKTGAAAIFRNQPQPSKPSVNKTQATAKAKPQQTKLTQHNFGRDLDRERRERQMGQTSSQSVQGNMIFQEIFLDEDSDEFEGFDIEDIDNIAEDGTGFNVDNWVEGGKEPSTFTFTGNAGINTDILSVPEEGSLSYLDYFECIITDNIIQKIVVETNRYAATYSETHPDLPSHSRYRKWTDTTLGEMKAFIAMTIAMGLVQQLDIQDYWSGNPVINTPFFRSVMSRDRFLSLLSVLHLADNSGAVPRGQTGYSPLQKLGEPYKDILSNFQSCYNPNKNIAIDEGMIPWRGNLHFRVYSPDKPIKYGLKVYMLCDSDNGYCSRMELYTGHGGQNSQFGATYDLIMRLADPFLNKGYHLYMDNYFSSPQLFYSLFLNATLACGTLRKNRRGVPQDLKDRRLVRGEMFVMNNDMLVAVKYADKKDVHLLTTIHKGVMEDSGKRDQEGIEIQKPDCILSYNKYMGAVDRCDQMVAYGSFERRTLKWWKKVFFHVLGLAVLNSYILYKTRSQQPVLQRVFRRELVNQLVTASEISGPSSRGRKRSSAEVLQRLSARHFICHLPSSGNRNHAKRRCVVCGPAEAELFRSANPEEPVPKRMGRETCFQCKQCQVALCIEPCFELFHTKAEYVLAYKRLKSVLEE